MARRERKLLRTEETDKLDGACNYNATAAIVAAPAIAPKRLGFELGRHGDASTSGRPFSCSAHVWTRTWERIVRRKTPKNLARCLPITSQQEQRRISED